MSDQKSFYETTRLYQIGLAYKTIGELLTNPQTRIGDIAETAHDLGIEFAFHMVAKADHPGYEDAEQEQESTDKG